LLGRLGRAAEHRDEQQRRAGQTQGIHGVGLLTLTKQCSFYRTYSRLGKGGAVIEVRSNSTAETAESAKNGLLSALCGLFGEISWLACRQRWTVANPRSTSAPPWSSPPRASRQTPSEIPCTGSGA